MTIAYNLLKWTDHNGVHFPNDEIDLPNTTPTEQADFQRLLEHGIITMTKRTATPAPTYDAPPEPEPEPVGESTPAEVAPSAPSTDTWSDDEK